MVLLFITLLLNLLLGLPQNTLHFFGSSTSRNSCCETRDGNSLPEGPCAHRSSLARQSNRSRVPSWGTTRQLRKHKRRHLKPIRIRLRSRNTSTSARRLMAHREQRESCLSQGCRTALRHILDGAIRLPGEISAVSRTENPCERPTSPLFLHHRSSFRLERHYSRTPNRAWHPNPTKTNPLSQTSTDPH